MVKSLSLREMICIYVFSNVCVYMIHYLNPKREAMGGSVRPASPLVKQQLAEKWSLLKELDCMHSSRDVINNSKRSSSTMFLWRKRGKMKGFLNLKLIQIEENHLNHPHHIFWVPR